MYLAAESILGGLCDRCAKDRFLQDSEWAEVSLLSDTPD